jgi:hypothetical protein
MTDNWGSGDFAARSREWYDAGLVANRKGEPRRVLPRLLGQLESRLVPVPPCCKGGNRSCHRTVRMTMLTLPFKPLPPSEGVGFCSKVCLR